MSNLIRPTGDMINVSINPTYRCNMRCEWCYLTKEQLKDSTFASLESIKSRLNEIAASGKTFATFDIYGGEISLLDRSYQLQLLELLNTYNPESINVISNLTLISSPLVSHPKTTLGVSFDFEFRPNHELVWFNMLHVGKPIHIIVLAIPELVSAMRKHGVARYINRLNDNNAIASVEIKPYSKNQANQLNVPDSDYEWVVKEWLSYGGPIDFEFVNAHALDYAVNSQFNAYSDDHVYITPAGRFAVLEFDENDNEFFLELDSFDDYIKWTVEEKNRVAANKHCASCKYMGKCLSEHLRAPVDVSASCNGHRDLISWYEQW